jgi:hypothetical protein
MNQVIKQETISIGSLNANVVYPREVFKPAIRESAAHIIGAHINANDMVRAAIDTLLKMFEEENFDKVTRAVFKGNDIPADKWSFLNRLIMYINGTDDTRGFRQWQRANRYVRKAARRSISSRPWSSSSRTMKLMKNAA